MHTLFVKDESGGRIAVDGMAMIRFMELVSTQYEATGSPRALIMPKCTAQGGIGFHAWIIGAGAPPAGWG